MSRFIMALVFTILPPSILSAKQTQKLDPIDVCSVIESVLVNADSIHSADCLVRERFTFDSSIDDENGELQGTLMRKTIFTRAVFDEDKKRFAYYSNTIAFRTFLPDFEESKNVDFDGWCCDVESGNEAKLGSFKANRTVALTDPGKLEETLEWERFPDYRIFGFCSGPCIFGRFRKDNTLKSMRNGKFFHSYQRRGQKLDIYFESGVKVLNEGDEFLKVYTFDLDQLVVTKVRAVFIANGKRQDIASFEIEWDEVNDIMVPISGRLEKFQNMHIDVNTSQSGKISQEFDFHWFTVNKEIEPQLFSIDNVKDRNAVLSMVDPVKLNATNLIDNDHTQNK